MTVYINLSTAISGARFDESNLIKSTKHRTNEAKISIQTVCYHRGAN